MTSTLTLTTRLLNITVKFDEETGNYYYSARYYDPKWSIYISVDPLADKYPGMNPYNYCFNSPINFIDPTGMEGQGWIREECDGKSTYTYRDDICDVDAAKAASFTDAVEVSDSVGRYNNQLGYNYSLNSDGSVFGVSQDHIGYENYSFTTRGGSTVNINGSNSNSSSNALAFSIAIPLTAGAGDCVGTAGIAVGMSAASAFALALVGSLAVGDTRRPDEPEIYLYKYMSTEGGMPMVGHGMNKLGIRPRDVDYVALGDRISALSINGLSTTMGIGSSIPINIPGGGNPGVSLYRINIITLPAVALKPTMISGNYWRITPLIDMTYHEFDMTVKSTARLWKKVE